MPIAPFFFNAAISSVINSGNEVPRARTVKPMTVCAIPKLEKNSNDSDKKSFPPIKNPIKLNVNFIKLTLLSRAMASLFGEKFFR